MVSTPRQVNLCLIVQSGHFAVRRIGLRTDKRAIDVGRET